MPLPPFFILSVGAALSSHRKKVPSSTPSLHVLPVSASVLARVQRHALFQGVPRLSSSALCDPDEDKRLLKTDGQ